MERQKRLLEEAKRRLGGTDASVGAKARLDYNATSNFGRWRRGATVATFPDVMEVMIAAGFIKADAVAIWRSGLAAEQAAVEDRAAAGIPTQARSAKGRAASKKEPG